MNSDVLVHECQAAGESKCYLWSSHSELNAVPDTIKLTEVSVNCSQTVMSFARDLILGFAFGIPFPADDVLVRQPGSDVV